MQIKTSLAVFCVTMKTAHNVLFFFTLAQFEKGHVIETARCDNTITFADSKTTFYLCKQKATHQSRFALRRKKKRKASLILRSNSPSDDKS